MSESKRESEIEREGQCSEGNISRAQSVAVFSLVLSVAAVTAQIVPLTGDCDSDGDCD